MSPAPPCRTYADMAGPELAAKYQTILFLAGSASAEFFADIGLCPWEAVKVILKLHEVSHTVYRPKCPLATTVTKQGTQPDLVSINHAGTGEGADSAWICIWASRWHAQVHPAGGSCRVRTQQPIYHHLSSLVPALYHLLHFHCSRWHCSGHTSCVQALQGTHPTVGSTDSLHHDEIW